jgi:hypothetical protein
MRWKLMLLGVVTALLVFIVVAPMFTLQVTVTMPPGAASPQPHEAQTFGGGIIFAIDALIVMAILALAAWIARRIVQQARGNSSAR